jgi:NADH dehydrogenase
VTKSIDQIPNSAKHVVIGGRRNSELICVRKLAANPNVRITLLDKNNYQQFQPLLYQVASAILAPNNVAFNLRGKPFGHPNVDVKMAEAVSIDLNTHMVRTRTAQFCAYRRRTNTRRFSFS